jgi:penicillin-binding protein 2
MALSTDRQRNIQLVIIFSALALIIQAARLQLFDASFRKRADATTIDNLTAYPSRGLVFDRKGKLIVNNNAMYDLMVTYNQIDSKMDTTKFCQLLEIKKEVFLENLKKDFRSGKFSRSVPFVFLKKIPVETYARLQESLYEFPGFFVQVRNIRGYPYHCGAHLLGYINEVDQRDIDREKNIYVPGDYIGDGGIEKKYERFLRGKKGSTYLLKDNLGRIVDKYQNGDRDTLAISGSDMVSSIDIDLQLYGEQLLQNKTGSIVAIEPTTGEILCMISGPTYDPNLLTMTQDRGKVFAALSNHPLKPFFDRTVMAKYPPGSIFKAAVTLIGLQEGTLNPDRGQGCGGGYFYAGRLYKCHHHAGISNVVDALANSCNTYYFQEYRNLIDKFGFTNASQGLDNLNKYLKEFGLGDTLGIDYPSESAGSIPTTAYYDRIYPKKLGGWRSPFIMSCGIGQGELQLTTLQMANFAACIANKGYWYPPHLAKEFKDRTPIPPQYRKKHISSIERRFFDITIEGMAGCVARGTARNCAIPDITVCGKTGTSQNPHGDDHSVFFAFAPKENPKIAIAVFVENATWGATYAGPIASLMIEKYLTGTVRPERKPMEEKMFKANLIEKFLKGKEAEEKAALLPVPVRDSLPKAEGIPSDDPLNIGGK